MLVLSSGIDSLYWSARGDVTGTVDALAAPQDAARKRGEAEPWREIDGFSLSVGPRGGLGYPFHLDCAEFRIHLGLMRQKPSFWVQLRSGFIHEVGPREAAARSVGVVASLSRSVLTDVGVSRIDPFADLGGLALKRGDLDGLVTTMDEIESHQAPRSEFVHSIRLGKFPLSCRIYDKRREIAKRGGFADAFWGDFDGPVGRVEFEIGSQRLRDFGIRTSEEVLPSVGDLWRYGTTRVVQFRHPGPGPVESWPVAEWWREVQEVGFRFASSGVVPFRIVQGDRRKVLQALRGYLTTFGAMEGVTTEAEALAHVGQCLGEVAHGRRFEDDVARKGARLPKAYRQARVA